MKPGAVLFPFLFCTLFFSCFFLYSQSETSGITWSKDTQSYFTVGDEGFIYEMDMNLTLTRTAYIGSFDLEGITYNQDKKTLFCLDEKRRTILEVDPLGLSIINIYPLELKKDKGRSYSQFESLVYIPGSDDEKGHFYIAASVQKKKKDFGILFSFTLEDLELFPIADLPLWDISGLTYDDEYFYMISDTEDLIARFSPATGLYESIPIDGNHQEGVVLTSDNQLLILDESGHFYNVSKSDF